MNVRKNKDDYAGPYFILEHDRLQPGDIILERGYEPHSELICRASRSNYSHAMIYVNDTIIEATRAGGVFSRVPNRSAVRAVTDFKVLRLTNYPEKQVIKTLSDHARSLIGSQYSVSEAILVKGAEFMRVFHQNSRKQFCSRLVAQCYHKAGIKLVGDSNFCSPGDIEQSGLMTIVPDMVRQASEQEAEFALGVSPHDSHIENSVKFINSAIGIFNKFGIKTLGTSDGEVVITTFNDISLAVFKNRNISALDEEITGAMYASGYLDHINIDRKQNPYRYDYTLFRYCISANADDDEIFERLRQEINREAGSFNVRMESYINGRNNLLSGLKYAEAEFSIVRGMLLGIYDRTVVIEEFSAHKKNEPGYKEVNDMSNKIIKEIGIHAPELTIE